MDINKLQLTNLWQTNHDVHKGCALKQSKPLTGHTGYSEGSVVNLPYTRWTRVKQAFHHITQRLIKPAAVNVPSYSTNRTLSTKQ